MSAFIVEDKTINTIITMLKNSESCFNSSWYIRKLKESGYYFEDGGEEKLGREMFELNCRAVDERYGEGQAKEFRNLNYSFNHQPFYTVISAYKSLQCWLYQCSEGTVPESPLFKLMQDISNNIANHIVSRMPEYEKAPWA
jgi:hypothetical protein